MNWKAILIVVSLYINTTAVVYCQINGNNLFEYQFGQLPNDTANISTAYNRTLVSYTKSNFKTSATIEQFYSPISNSSYFNVSQFSLQQYIGLFEIKVGNFYETLGRGTLLRSFEVPGAIIEDLSYRSRHYFNRDVLGAAVKFQKENLKVKAIYGRPLNYVFPPTQTFDLKRPDLIGALYSDYTYKKQTLGLAAMHHQNNDNNDTYALLTLSGLASPAISYYTELSKNISDFEFVDFSNQASFAMYGGINLTLNNFGLSFEVKNYKNILIGAGINEPPALVKEHSYKVLNRSTHVMQPTDEIGYQIEAFYTFSNASVLTVNNTLAVNNIGDVFKFKEYFAEYDFLLFNQHYIKLFVDYAQDPFKLEKDRFSTGFNSEWKILEASAIRLDFEYQTFNRLDSKYTNCFFAVGYAYKSKITLSLNTDYSTDSFIVNEGSKTWFSGNVKYKISKAHTAQLFVGNRRGGPACNAGVCYEVLDFKGVELRVTSRF